MTATFLTNLTMNSRAGVLREIQKQYSIHWFLGLRQAELFIFDRSQVLAQHYQKQKEFNRQVEAYKRQLNQLRQFQNHWMGQWIYALLVGHKSWFGEPELALNQKIEHLEDLIEAAEQQQSFLEPLIRDAINELRAAEQMKEQIVSSHPEALSMSYDELQERFSSVALSELQVLHMAARVWAVRNYLPEGVGQTIFEHGIAERGLLLQRVNQMVGEAPLLIQGGQFVDS